MISGGWSAGLTDQDELSAYPSAANPLTALGIDPDEARANPDLLARLSAGRGNGGPTTDLNGSRPGPGSGRTGPSAVSMPSGDDSAAQKPSSSTTSGSVDVRVPTDEAAGKGMAALQQNLADATKVANSIPTDDPETARLTAQRNALSVPAPLYDPQTGKMLAGDKPSVGQRIWRGVRGGLVGLATGGIPGAIVGAVEPGDIRGGKAYGAPNPTYEHNEQRREQQLASTDTALANARENWKSAVDAMKAKGGLVKDIASTANDMVTGYVKLSNAAVSQFRAEATADNYKTKAEEAEKKLQEQYAQLQNSRTTADERIAMMRDLAAQRNEIMQAQLAFAKDKLSTVNDARTLDKQEAEDVASIEKKYSTGLSGTWNRLTGNKQQEVAATHKLYQDRRSALGIMPGGPPAAAGPQSGAKPTAAPPPGATHVAPGSDGRFHYTNSQGKDLGVAPQ